jgi:hypothetical protein
MLLEILSHGKAVNEADSERTFPSRFPTSTFCVLRWRAHRLSFVLSIGLPSAPRNLALSSRHSAGMAALISFAKPSLAPHDLRLGPIRSALLMVRLLTAFIVLHIFEILLWAAFYRGLCIPLWESAFYFSTSSYATAGYGDIVSRKSGGP